MPLWFPHPATSSQKFLCARCAFVVSPSSYIQSKIPLCTLCPCGFPIQLHPVKNSSVHSVPLWLTHSAALQSKIPLCTLCPCGFPIQLHPVKNSSVYSVPLWFPHPVTSSQKFLGVLCAFVVSPSSYIQSKIPLCTLCPCGFPIQLHPVKNSSVHSVPLWLTHPATSSQKFLCVLCDFVVSPSSYIQSKISLCTLCLCGFPIQLHPVKNSSVHSVPLWLTHPATSSQKFLCVLCASVVNPYTPFPSSKETDSLLNSTVL